MIPHRTSTTIKKPVYLLCSMMFFWYLFDAVISYITPLIITEKGFSNTAMGIILGTSSIGGALFDFFLCKTFKNTTYRRVFAIMFALCIGYPLFLYHSQTAGMFIIAMIIWGIYFDLKNVGIFDFVARATPQKEFTENFGLIQIFETLGYLIAPILIGFLTLGAVAWQSYFIGWIFLFFSLLFFIIMLRRREKNIHEIQQDPPKRSIFLELYLWKKCIKILSPVLLLVLFLYVSESFFWTIGPIFAEQLLTQHPLGGFFMAAHTFPSLLVGWFVGKLTQKYGKKHTAFWALFLGSFILALLHLTQNPVLIVLQIFASSFFIAMSFPAINGAFADYIRETLQYEKEIEGIQDFYTNIGFIIGPMMAGFLSDHIGIAPAFSLLGVIGCIVSIILLSITPKKIRVIIKETRTSLKKI